jgi:osmoprotectant transport system substrate-binding protein
MTRINRGTTALAVIGLAGVLTLSACGGGSGKSSNPLNAGGGNKNGTVTVGSANFTEDVLLAEIYSQALEAKGVKVKQQFNIGSRETYYPLIKSGTITIFPEYNGALLSYLNPKATANSTDDVDNALKAALPSSLEVLNPAAAQDKDSLVVTQATASKDKLSTISDLKPYASSFVIGGPSEFQTRQQGLLGLKSLYGLTFKSFKALDEDGPITHSALQHGNVQVADLFTTDPDIQVDHFVVLSDPKNVFGAQNVIPLVNKAGLTSTEINALNAVSAKLDTNTLLTLNKETTVDKQDPDTVAANWLKSVGLS